jgi:U3 small nucleolar RNA-associated protein 10
MEHSSVECMVKLTLRLSESKFRPLFLRFLEWSKVSPADEASLDEAAVYQRPLALFAVVNALVERLRSVFVPYFKHLMPHCLDALNQDGDEGGASADNNEDEPKKKKKKKQEQSKGAATSAAANDNKAVVSSKWLLRLRAIRALHRCFLYDSIGFLDTVRYDYIMPAVVQQLTASPPPSVFPSLRQDSQYTGMSEEAALVYGESVLALPSNTTTGGNDDTISIDSGTTKGPLHVYQRAAVAAVAQLAVTAGSDSAWKSLNHAVCLATRTSLLDVGGRLTALCALHQLVEKLSEEYLVLLPETLPFLAELLEDAELVVEAAARDVVKRLEEVSGESLAEYLR